MSDSTATPGSSQARSTQRILSIDLGKFNSVACDYDTSPGTHAFTTLPTRPQTMHDLLVGIQSSVLGTAPSYEAGYVKS